MFGIHFGAHGDAATNKEEENAAVDSGEELMPASPPQPKRSSPRKGLARQQRTRKPAPSQKHKYDETRDDGGTNVDMEERRGRSERLVQVDKDKKKEKESPRRRHALKETGPARRATSPRKTSASSRIMSPRKRAEGREEREPLTSPRKRASKKDLSARARAARLASPKDSGSWSSSSSFSSDEDSRGTRDTFSDGSQSYSRSEGTYSDDATLTDGTITDEGTVSNDKSFDDEEEEEEDDLTRTDSLSSEERRGRGRTYTDGSDDTDEDSENESRVVAASFSSESSGSSETGTDDSYAMYEARSSPRRREARDYTSRFAPSPAKETLRTKKNSKHGKTDHEEMRKDSSSRVPTDHKKGKKQSRSGGGGRIQKKQEPEKEPLSVVTIPPSPREVSLVSPRRRQPKEQQQGQAQQAANHTSCQTPKTGNGNRRGSISSPEVRDTVDDGHLGKYSINKEQNSRKNVADTSVSSTAVEASSESTYQFSEDTARTASKPERPRFTRRPSVVSSASQETVEIIQGVSTDEEPDSDPKQESEEHLHKIVNVLQAPKVLEADDDGVEIVKADTMEETDTDAQSQTETDALTTSAPHFEERQASTKAAMRDVSDGAWQTLLSTTVKTVPRDGDGSDEEIRSVHSRLTVAEPLVSLSLPVPSTSNKYDLSASVQSSSGDSISLVEPTTNDNVWSQSSAMFPLPVPARSPDESVRYISTDRAVPTPLPPPAAPQAELGSAEDESMRYITVKKEATTPRRRRVQKPSKAINPKATEAHAQAQAQEEDESLRYIKMDQKSATGISMVPIQRQRQHQRYLSPTFSAPRAQQDNSDSTHPFSTAFEDHVSSLEGKREIASSPGALTTGETGPMFPMVSDPAEPVNGNTDRNETSPMFPTVSAPFDMNDLITQERQEYDSDDMSDERAVESERITQDQDIVISAETTTVKQDSDAETTDISQKKRQNKPQPEMMDALAHNVDLILRLDSSEDPWDVALAPTRSSCNKEIDNANDESSFLFPETQVRDDKDVDVDADVETSRDDNEHDDDTPILSPRKEEFPLSPSVDSLRSFEGQMSIQTVPFEEDVRSDNNSKDRVIVVTNNDSPPSRTRTESREDAEWITFASELDFSPTNSSIRHGIADASAVSSGNDMKKVSASQDLGDQPPRLINGEEIILDKEATAAPMIDPSSNSDWEASFLADESSVASSVAPTPLPSPRKRFVEAAARQRVERRRSLSTGSDMKSVQIVTAKDPCAVSTAPQYFSPRHAHAASANHINSPRKRAARLPQSSPLLDDHYSVDACAAKPRSNSRSAPLALPTTDSDRVHDNNREDNVVLTRPTTFSPRHQQHASIVSPRRGRMPPGGGAPSPRRRIRLKIPTPTSTLTATQAQSQYQPYSELDDAAIGQLD